MRRLLSNSGIRLLLRSFGNHTPARRVPCHALKFSRLAARLVPKGTHETELDSKKCEPFLARPLRSSHSLDASVRSNAAFVRRAASLQQTADASR